LARFLAYEAFTLIHLKEKKIDTWLDEASFNFLPYVKNLPHGNNLGIIEKKYYRNVTKL